MSPGGGGGVTDCTSEGKFLLKNKKTKGNFTQVEERASCREHVSTVTQKQTTQITVQVWSGEELNFLHFSYFIPPKHA